MRDSVHVDFDLINLLRMAMPAGQPCEKEVPVWFSNGIITAGLRTEMGYVAWLSFSDSFEGQRKTLLSELHEGQRLYLEEGTLKIPRLGARTPQNVANMDAKGLADVLDALCTATENEETKECVVLNRINIGANQPHRYCFSIPYVRSVATALRKTIKGSIGLYLGKYLKLTFARPYKGEFWLAPRQHTK